MRPLTHHDHRKFVETEGWQKKGTARSTKQKGDHFRYTLTLATGDVLYTRVSHGAGQLDNADAVKSVFRDQLQVAEEDFYRCVEKGVLPPRPKPPEAERPAEALDAKLARNLIRCVGLSQDAVATMTVEEAVAAWNEYLTSGGSRAAFIGGVLAHQADADLRSELRELAPDTTDDLRPL